ncbi:hypothetical protein Nmel_016158 [Mimus melanotis]
MAEHLWLLGCSPAPTRAHPLGGG